MTLGLHLMLLDDTRRTRAFDRALAEVVRPGDVVADLGCGSGILSLLALKHGAARVYSIERDASVQVARAAARENGVQDRMRVIRGNSEKIRLPERVDVVVTETLGMHLFDERILELAADARRRFLRRGGSFIPSRIRVMGAPAIAKGRPWTYGVRLEAIRARALHSAVFAPRPRLRGAARILGEAVLGRDVRPLEVGGRWRGGPTDGMVLWFDAELSPGVRLSSLRSTHWEPVFVPARQRRRGAFEFRLTFQPDGHLTWRFDADTPQSTMLTRT